MSHQGLSDTSDPKPTGDCSPPISVHQLHEDRDSLCAWGFWCGSSGLSRGGSHVVPAPALVLAVVLPGHPPSPCGPCPGVAGLLQVRTV